MANAADTSLGPIHESLECTVQIPGFAADAVRVASFQAEEHLSSPFRYTVQVATSPDDVANLEAALGKDATFLLQRDGAFERGVHGILTEIWPDGAYVGKNQVRTSIVIEPRLANLRYSGGFRIFQKQTVKDIVAALVAPERVDVEWRVRPDPPVRDYRTQLDESDLDLLERLAADEGLTYFFEHTADTTTLVFTNNPKGFHPLDGNATLDFRDTGGAVTGDHVRSIQRGSRVRTGAVEHRDYDFTKPRIALVGRSETTGTQSEANTKRREWRDYPGGFTDPDAEGTPRAKMRLEELRADAAVMLGTSSTPRLFSGGQFMLTGHSDKAFNVKLVVTDVSLSGSVQGAFDQSSGARGPRTDVEIVRFIAVAADTPLRPARKKKPLARLQTARVVGPAEGDPNVDDSGRVNVQFMWDRDGKFDQHSSCAIRMATPNAHSGEGFWTALRVGSEVLVDFLDGDIDRPIIIGAVYNGQEGQPYKQPGGQSRSTWKVRGIPGGTGYNEITFENKTGSEQIILHAQKDQNETILNDHNENIGANHTAGIGSNQNVTIGANQTVSIGSNQTISVGADRSLSVTGNETISIGANETISIGANESAQIAANRTTAIGGDDSLTIAGSRTKMVAVADTVLVGAARSLTAASEAVTVGSRVKTVATSETTTVGGGRTETVGGDETISIAGQRGTTVGANETVGVGATFSITVADTYSLKVGDDACITLTKGGDIVLKTGDATLSMSKDGTIELKGKNVTVEASSDMGVKGDSVAVKGSSKVDIN
jgi:type VI secretion system secreted protein VgrG